MSHITRKYHGSPHSTGQCSQWSGVHVCLRKRACSISQQSTIVPCPKGQGIHGKRPRVSRARGRVQASVPASKGQASISACFFPTAARGGGRVARARGGRRRRRAGRCGALWRRGSRCRPSGVPPPLPPGVWRRSSPRRRRRRQPPTARRRRRRQGAHPPPPPPPPAPRPTRGAGERRLRPLHVRLLRGGYQLWTF